MDLSMIGTLKVAELKAELEKRNISKSGTKSVLVERLRQALTSEHETVNEGDNEVAETNADEAPIDYEPEDMADTAADTAADTGDTAVEQTDEAVEGPVEEAMEEGTEEEAVTEAVVEDASLLDDDAIDYGDLDYGDETKEEIISFQIDDAEALSLDVPEPEVIKKVEEQTPVEQKEEPVKTAETDDKAKRPSRPTEGGPDVSKMVWVSNLSRQTRALDLKTLFGTCGKVMSAKVVMNPNAKDAKCFGLITMNTETEADKAISRLNTHVLHERVITCERPRKDNAVLKKVKPPPSSTDKKVASSRPSGIRPRQTSPKEPEKKRSPRDERKRKPIEAPSNNRARARSPRDSKESKESSSKPFETGREARERREREKAKSADTGPDKDRRVVATSGDKPVISVSLDNSKPESSRPKSPAKRSSPARRRSPVKRASPPRRRTRSPRPRRRTRSPRKRSPRARSPRKSPVRRVVPPRKSRSPLRVDRSLAIKRISPSPARRPRSPRRSPRRSPTKRPRSSRSPRRSTHSPRRSTHSPRRSARSPRRATRSPSRKVEAGSGASAELELLRAQTAKQEAAIKALMQGNMSNIGQMLGDKLTEKLATDLKSALVKQLQNTVKTMSSKAAGKSQTEEIVAKQITHPKNSNPAKAQPKNIPIVPILQPLPPKFPTPTSTPFVQSKPAFNPLMVSHPKPQEEARPRASRTEPRSDSRSDPRSDPRSDSRSDYSSSRRSSDYRSSGSHSSSGHSTSHGSSSHPSSGHSGSHGSSSHSAHSTSHSSSHGKQRQEYPATNGYTQPAANSINDLLKSLQGVKEIINDRPDIPVQTYGHHLPQQPLQQSRIIPQQPIMTQQPYPQPPVNSFRPPPAQQQANQWQQYAQPPPHFPPQQPAPQQPTATNNRYRR